MSAKFLTDKASERPLKETEPGRQSCAFGNYLNLTLKTQGERRPYEVCKRR